MLIYINQVPAIQMKYSLSFHLFFQPNIRVLPRNEAKNNLVRNYEDEKAFPKQNIQPFN
jgi:hypothetical protein